nr:MAG TPA: hypothetical protein [Caudoviricetes sp.]
MAKVILTIELDDAQELSRVSALLTGAPAPEMAVKVDTSKLAEALKAPIAKKESPAKETPAEAAPAEAAHAEAASEYSLEDIQRAFRAKRTKDNMNLMKEIVQAHGGTRLSDIPVASYPALMAELDALVVS